MGMVASPVEVDAGGSSASELAAIGIGDEREEIVDLEGFAEVIIRPLRPGCCPGCRIVVKRADNDRKVWELVA
jgi:hypothetical protein